MLTTIYKDEQGKIAAVKIASEDPEEARRLNAIAEQFKAKPVTPPVIPPVAPVPAPPITPEEK